MSLMVSDRESFARACMLDHIAGYKFEVFERNHCLAFNRFGALVLRSEIVFSGPPLTE